MLDFETFVFIRAHNWMVKKGDEVGGSNNEVCARKL